MAYHSAILLRQHSYSIKIYSIATFARPKRPMTGSGESSKQLGKQITIELGKKPRKKVRSMT